MRKIKSKLLLSDKLFTVWGEDITGVMCVKAGAIFGLVVAFIVIVI